MPARSKRMSRTGGTATLALLLLAGCGEGEADPASRGPELPGTPPALADVGGDWRLARQVLAADEAAFLDPGWAVLDGAEAAVHVLDGEGALVRSLGGRGDGPGELGIPRLLAGAGGLLWVVGGDGRVDRLDASGTFLGRSTLTLDGCPLPELKAAAVLEGRLHLAVRCVLDRRGRLLVAAVDDDGGARPLLDLPSPSGRSFSIFSLSLAAAGGRLAVGTGRARCVLLVDAAGRPAGGEACVAGAPVPLPEPLRRDLEGRLGRQARAMGLSVEIPDHLPWFDRLLEGPDGALVARRPRDETWWDLERIGPDAGRWSIPVGVDVHGGGGRLLLVHQGLEGTSFRTAHADSLPWAPVDAPGR